MRSQPLAWALACAVALVAAPGASAQSRPSLADRVAALEARDQGQGQQNMDLLNRITQLEADVKQLRALVEQMQNDNQQAGERAKAQYIDLDSRLARLEGTATAPSTPATQAPPKAPPASKPPQARTPATGASPGPSAATAPPAAAAGNGSAGAAPPASEQASYDAALAAVRADQFADSAKRFNDFVQQYPDSPLASNAYYWMGESYYVTQNYQFALTAFQTVVARYPDSAKTPGAMLKVGYCQDGLKQRSAAEATLRQVIARYPNSEEANQAQSRLRAMSMDAGG